MTTLNTPRLTLEPLDERHFDGLYDLNRDAVVMRYITGQPDTPDDTRGMIERVKLRWRSSATRGGPSCARRTGS